MGRKKIQRSTKFESYVREYGSEVIKAVGKSIWCVQCEEEIKGAYDRKSNIDKHLRTFSHTSKQNRKRTSSQATLDKVAAAESKQSRFNKFLCKMFVKSSIPLYKVNGEAVREFISEWFPVINPPDESNLRKFYMPQLFDKHLSKLRDYFDGKLIWAAMDETRDKTGGAVGAVVAGVLDTTI